MEKRSFLTMMLLLCAIVACVSLTCAVPAESANASESSVNNPLCFTALDDTEIDYVMRGSLTDIHIQISVDGSEWEDWEEYSPFELKAGDVRYVRNTENTLSVSESDYFSFDVGQVTVSGDVSSMINYAPLSDYCYYELFCCCDGPLDLSKLELPATVLAPHCYERMFYGNHVDFVPILPADKLVDSCYREMFSECSMIIELRCFATDISAKDSTKDWLRGTGVHEFYAPDLYIWSYGDSGIPDHCHAWSSYKVTLNPGLDGTVTPAYMMADFGVLVSELPIPVKEGLVFDCWVTEDDEKVDQSYVFDRNTEIYAAWNGTGPTPLPDEKDTMPAVIAISAVIVIALLGGAVSIIRKK